MNIVHVRSFFEKAGLQYSMKCIAVERKRGTVWSLVEAEFGERKGEAGWSQWLEPQGRGWMEAKVGYGKEEPVLSIKFE